MVSNMTFPCVNPIQLGPSSFNSSQLFQPIFLKFRLTKVDGKHSIVTGRLNPLILGSFFCLGVTYGRLKCKFMCERFLVSVQLN